MNNPAKKANLNVLKNYSFSILLIVSIAIGALIGIYLRQDAVRVKPLGDLFLNLLFTAVIPLVFFSISSAVAGMTDLKRLGKIMFWMVLIFIVTGVLSSALMVVGVKMFPPVIGANPALNFVPEISQSGTADKIVRALSVPDFADLLNKKNMLALILFSILVGLATSSAGEKGKPFANFLASANEVAMKVISYIMLYAPIGIGAYFAYLVGVFGPELLGSYLRVVALYYPLSLLYFFIGYTLYAYLAAGFAGVKIFWARIITPSLTALGTGSSIATIPTNLKAADEIGVPRDISQIVIPIGTMIHKDGTSLAAILKIALLFSFFGMDFSGPATIATAIGVGLLSGMVMSGIPGGAFLGELLIVTLYGFPVAALPMISMVGTLVDMPATMVNAVGDNVSSMLVARIMGGKHWLSKHK
ncbi:MAG: dicarboxylate/amino acid:cation symporter [Candidatus Omnitrophica bacterium]|nr:dicarboxylate/amino acid:cation symporter [Candidatus Omnitrophota bacterium]